MIYRWHISSLSVVTLKMFMVYQDVFDTQFDKYIDQVFNQCN